VGAFIAIAYFVGFFVAMVVIRHRAGVGQRRLKIFGPGGVGLDWFVVTFVITLFWPVSLGVWLARGRPEPRIVFNERAEERERATNR
jgi:hypothetical protein